MHRKILFVVSIIIILVVSWANIVYFGYVKRNQFPPMVNQSAHLICLAITGAIGYINWRRMQKWLLWLWLLAYGAVFIMIGLFFIVFAVTHGHINPTVKSTVIGVRNRFTEPVPFLVFYILHSVKTRIADVNVEAKGK